MEKLEHIERTVINDMRYYKVTQFESKDDKIGKVTGIFPSVTSILGATSEKLYLKKWIDKVGKKEAEYILQAAGKRGTVMHKLCELYLSFPMMMDPAIRLEETLKLSNKDSEVNEFDTRSIIVGGMLFYNFIRVDSFNIIKETKMQERFLWSLRGGGFAGTVDNVSELWNGEDCVIDFKTARKKKDPKGIDDYKCQVAAYAVAVFDRTGIKPKTANIMISNEADAIPQVIHIDSNELNLYYKRFIERLTEFYIKFPPIELDGNKEVDLF